MGGQVPKDPQGEGQSGEEFWLNFLGGGPDSGLP